MSRSPIQPPKWVPPIAVMLSAPLACRKRLGATGSATVGGPLFPCLMAYQPMKAGPVWLGPTIFGPYE